MGQGKTNTRRGMEKRYGRGKRGEGKEMEKDGDEREGEGKGTGVAPLASDPRSASVVSLLLECLSWSAVDWNHAATVAANFVLHSDIISR